MGKTNSKINKFQELLESNDLLLKLAFGAAIVFMGFAFLPVQYDVVGKLGICLVFLSIGAFTIVFSVRKISDSPLFIYIRYTLYLIIGIFFLVGSVFLFIFAISKLSLLVALLFSMLLFIL